MNDLRVFTKAWTWHARGRALYRALSLKARMLESRGIDWSVGRRSVVGTIDVPDYDSTRVLRTSYVQGFPRIA